MELNREAWRDAPAELRHGLVVDCDYGLSGGTWVAFDSSVDLDTLLAEYSDTDVWHPGAVRWATVDYAARFLGLGGLVVLYCPPLRALCLPTFALQGDRTLHP